jgi:acetoacetyl-CoA synthetase
VSRGPVVWSPAEDAAASSQLARYMRVLDDRARTEIVETIRAAASQRHVPDEIVQVPAIPRTMTGRKLEVPVKRLFMGAEAATAVNRNAVADPAALDAFVELAAARTRTARH